MISHEMAAAKFTWKKTLVWDFLIPLVIVLGVGFFIDHLYARRFLQALVDLPVIGWPIYRSPLFLFYVKWHLLLFTSPILLLSFAVSFKTARIPGPGRAFLRFWQGLLDLKIRKEEHVDIFPPPFNRNHPAVKNLVDQLMERAPLSRLLGFYKRFASDIERERREGKKTEGLSAFFPVVLTEELRYRHIQVVGGSGSGKSASIIAPMLLQDAASRSLATLTINPKADLYLLKVMATGARKNRIPSGRIPSGGMPSERMPTAVISFSRKDSLSYDPLLYGDADTLTKKIMGSSEITHPFYKAYQETWLMSFFRVMKTESLLKDRIMLRHLFHFLTKPSALVDELKSQVKSPHNIKRLLVLAAAKPESLAGVQSHIAQLVEDESLSHIFDNPNGRFLNLREIVTRGGNIFIEVDTSSKGPQGRALGRMIMMEVQLLAGARQAGIESMEVGLQVYLDEFASFAYSGFIDLIDKCRSAKVGLLLAHQSLGNLRRDNLSSSFKDEIVDNTYTKFFLSLKDETAQWASRQLGERKVVKKSLSISFGTDKTSTSARENKTISFHEELENYVEPSDFNLRTGFGYANLENKNGRIVKAPIRLGYLDEKDLCTDKELLTFLRESLEGHPERPRRGSLIDNEIPPGDPGYIQEPMPFNTTEGDALTHGMEEMDRLELLANQGETKPPEGGQVPGPVPGAGPADSGKENPPDLFNLLDGHHN